MRAVRSRTANDSDTESEQKVKADNQIYLVVGLYLFNEIALVLKSRCAAFRLLLVSWMLATLKVSDVSLSIGGAIVPCIHRRDDQHE